jgi:hypothetical protein
MPGGLSPYEAVLDELLHRTQDFVVVGLLGHLPYMLDMPDHVVRVDDENRAGKTSGRRAGPG